MKEMWSKLSPQAKVATTAIVLFAFVGFAIWQQNNRFDILLSQLVLAAALAGAIGFSLVWFIERVSTLLERRRQDESDELPDHRGWEDLEDEYDEEDEESRGFRPDLSGEESNPPPTGRRVPDEDFREGYRENYG